MVIGNQTITATRPSWR